MALSFLCHMMCICARLGLGRRRSVCAYPPAQAGAQRHLFSQWKPLSWAPDDRLVNSYSIYEQAILCLRSFCCPPIFIVDVVPNSARHASIPYCVPALCCLARDSQPSPRDMKRWSHEQSVLLFLLSLAHSCFSFLPFPHTYKGVSLHCDHGQ